MLISQWLQKISGSRICSPAPRNALRTVMGQVRYRARSPRLLAMTQVPTNEKRAVSVTNKRVVKVADA